MRRARRQDAHGEKALKVWDGASKVLSHAAALSAVMNDSPLDDKVKMEVVKILWREIVAIVEQTEKV